jgi:ABC-2 type transport system ATP-binding protein
MNEVEQLCTRLAIIARGRIRFTGTLDELKERQSGPDYRLRVTDVEGALAVGRDVPGVEVFAAADHPSEILAAADTEAAGRLTIALGRAGVGVLAMLPQAPTLEDFFFELTEEVSA